ncbi:uncharacterized protein LOC116010707 [Ipomoea triloba]|uniref:uncharacterized protein LOC116010707 n=1 Tax=Ipomoea triloba TaxID=35885 RepID=UPI00125D0DF6|nr:uncharacterized protein LOC116010707 [Ipomoea triloba]
MSATCSEIVWLCGILSELGFLPIDPTPLHGDNTSSIQIDANLVYHECTKHIEVNCHYIKEAFTRGVITPSHLTTYPQFLREILSRKRKFGAQEIITMTQECRVLINDEEKLPSKLRDLRSFTIACVIGGLTINRSLCDLGAGVNVMPLSLYKRLYLGEPKPVQLTLEFADRSTKSPIGILEDVPVRVDKYFVPCDFIVMDIREDPCIPIIMGRPFLATTGAMIDVRKGSIIFNFGEEKVAVNVFDEPKSPCVEKCFVVDVIEGKIHDEGEHFDPHVGRALDEFEVWKIFSSNGGATFVQLERNPMVEKVEK